jgi:hypothetical protein
MNLLPKEQPKQRYHRSRSIATFSCPQPLHPSAQHDAFVNIDNPGRLLEAVSQQDFKCLGRFFLASLLIVRQRHVLLWRQT